MANNETAIWNYLMSKIGNAYGVAGLMGNIHAESGLVSSNLQNTYNKKLNMTDEQYTAAVDNGTYSEYDFVHDKAGYGLVQWTYWSLKQELYTYVKSKGASIGDLSIQLEFLCKQLSSSYKTVWDTLKNAKSVLEASNVVLLKFERPADQSESVQNKRASYGQTYYDKYATKDTKDTSVKGDNSIMSNSSLVNYTCISPNKTSPRNHAIDTITIHCVVGQVTAERLGDIFKPSSRQASSNYGVDKDGRIGMYVEEKDRSWCSSSSSNDNRAITIEVASDTTHPYAVTDKALNALIKLCADICKRNNIKELKWKGDKSLIGQVDKQNMTVHRWFANKSCPGDYLYERHGYIASEVNKLLGSITTIDTGSTTKPTTNKTFPATPFTVDVLISDLNYRSEPSMKGTIKGQTGKGKFTITEVSDGWGKLKSGAGWIYLENSEYCTIGKTVAGNSTSQQSKSNVPYTVRVTISDLNIRTGAGTNYPKTGKYTGKGSFTIVEEKQGNVDSKGTKGTWGKLKSGAGWICLSVDGVKKV